MKGYKTLIWNAGNALIFAMDMADTQYEIPAEWMPYWIGAYILGNIVLRFFTTTPVGKK